MTASVVVNLTIWVYRSPGKYSLLIEDHPVTWPDTLRPNGNRGYNPQGCEKGSFLQRELIFYLNLNKIFSIPNKLGSSALSGLGFVPFRKEKKTVLAHFLNSGWLSRLCGCKWMEIIEVSSYNYERVCRSSIANEDHSVWDIFVH